MTQTANTRRVVTLGDPDEPANVTVGTGSLTAGVPGAATPETWIERNWPYVIAGGAVAGIVIFILRHHHRTRT